MFYRHNRIKAGINDRNKLGKFSNIWKLNNIYLNNPWIKQDTSRDTRKYFELMENEYITDKNSLDAVKAVFRG